MELIGYASNVSGLDTTFAALADPTRRAILARLATGEASVMELAEPFEMSQPAISKHLKVLERAGLISRGSEAQRRPRKLEARPLAEATEWLEQYREFWEASFGRLDSLLSELKLSELKKTGLKSAEQKSAAQKNIGPKNRTIKIETIKMKAIKIKTSKLSNQKHGHAGPGREKK
jgi:DNA-binding transcriptional ArsR family regulator